MALASLKEVVSAQRNGNTTKIDQPSKKIVLRVW
jgi:hypothetical protein